MAVRLSKLEYRPGIREIDRKTFAYMRKPADAPVEWIRCEDSYLLFVIGYVQSHG
jgi:hypothetical protein